MIIIVAVLVLIALVVVGVKFVPPEYMAKRIRPRSPLKPSIFNYFSNSIWEAGPDTNVSGPGLKFYIRFLERLEIEPFGEVGPNQFGVLIGRYGPASSGVFAPLIPAYAFESMKKTMEFDFEAGLNIRYITGQWKGIYDWKQYLLVTANNIYALKQTDEGKRLIPSWLTTDLLKFVENESGKQLLVTCRGGLKKAKRLFPDANTIINNQGKVVDQQKLPNFTEVKRVIRPKGYGEILDYGIRQLKDKGIADIKSITNEVAADKKEPMPIDYSSLEQVEKALTSDSNICKGMLDLLLKSNNYLHKDYSDIDALINCFNGYVEPSAFLYGVDRVAIHAIPGHIFKIESSPLVHSASGQILTIDSSFGIISAVGKEDPTGDINMSELTLESKLDMYKTLFAHAHLVPPGFVGIFSVTIPTASTWAIRPESFRLEPGKIGERTYFFGQSPQLYGERQVDVHLGAITMSDADANEITLDIDLRTQARPRVWPRLRYVFGYIDDQITIEESKKITSWTEFNLVNSLVAPILNGVIAEIIGGRRTTWFYGEGEIDQDYSTDSGADDIADKKAQKALEEIAGEANKKMQHELGFLGMVFRSMVKKRVGPKAFEDARSGKSIARQSLETAKMETLRNVEKAKAVVAEADGKAKAVALNDLRRYQALVQGFGKEGATLMQALEKAKIPNVLAVGSEKTGDTVTGAAIALGMMTEIQKKAKEIALTVPDSPSLEPEVPTKQDEKTKTKALDSAESSDSENKS